MLIRNNSRITKYFCVNEKKFLNLNEVTFKTQNFNEASLDAHKKNCKFLSLNPSHYLPVLEGIYPVPPKSAWHLKDEVFSQAQHVFIDTTINYEIKDLKASIKTLLKSWKKPLGVELSGGLDTSIVIGLLRSVDEEPYLIGALSDRFEFRTERFIQEKLILDLDKTCLFKDTDGLPFSALKDTPPHFLPNKSSLFFNCNMPTLKAAKKFGISIVLNGIGLDSLLIDAIGPGSQRYYFDIANIDDSWANDYVFFPHGVSYLSVATIPFVKRMLVSLRRGQPEDTQKLWARKYFANQIPQELSKFAYKASFGAVYHEGLEGSVEEILSITSFAHSLTGILDFEEIRMKQLINKVLSYDYESEFLFFALLSYAVWVYQLNKIGCIEH
jgi:hypothetical protein